MSRLQRSSLSLGESQDLGLGRLVRTHSVDASVFRRKQHSGALGSRHNEAYVREEGGSRPAERKKRERCQKAENEAALSSRLGRRAFGLREERSCCFARRPKRAVSSRLEEVQPRLPLCCYLFLLLLSAGTLALSFRL